MRTTINRRALVAGAASAAVAAPAIAAPALEPDPIFAAIEAHREAEARFSQMLRSQPLKEATEGRIASCREAKITPNCKSSSGKKVSSPVRPSTQSAILRMSRQPRSLARSRCLRCTIISFASIRRCGLRPRWPPT